jgi:putative phosphoribosyl transferase
VVVIGLARGGIVTAYEVAKYLNTPLDVICTMKIGSPINPEFAVAAITESGHIIKNNEVIDSLAISSKYLEKAAQLKHKEALERVKIFRGCKNKLDVFNKTVIVVDDGLATGLTMQAAIKSLKEQKAKSVVVAVPVASPDSLEFIKKICDEVYCLSTPTHFHAVGQFYDIFEQTSSDEVCNLLKKSQEHL